MSTATIPSKLLEIGEHLRTQDNRCTADPMFCVQVCEREGPIVPGYSEDGIVYFDHNQCETYYRGSEEFGRWDQAYNDGDLPDHVTRSGYKDVWKTVAVCFTEAGCEEHLRQNGHNYRHYHGTRIYAESFFRNPEMQAIREFLMGQKAVAP